ncbi:hypothetical protein B0J17DRAFT_349474 [Rhizoctonia solani]|nr:hypothetical protein B0J17DRAFT_349474 [Rhizoctonia solani]
MSHPLYWLAKQFFYPIGNTPATSFTHDLSPERSADVLLLGCGDPRNILYTLYYDLTVGNVPRKMDITCCDVEPAVLARNILLFSLLEDGDETTERIWDIFYHFKIDDQTANVIERQSRKLHDCAQDARSWRQSRYGSFLEMADSKTLAELRRHWGFYADYSGLPADWKARLVEEQVRLSKSVVGKNQITITPSRSAGMVWPKALGPVSELFRKYWETGTTYPEANDIERAINLNPTFLYYLSGESFNLHYGSFPQGFHLLPAFAPIAEDPVGPLSPTGSAAISKSRQQFKAWCESLRPSRAANAITIRFYCGDALAFCHALNTFKLTGNPSTNLFTAPYKASQIHLDELAARSPQVPLAYDVIDTSNLIDHVGLLNLLIAAPSLLKQNPSSQSVLYTEALLSSGEDATNSFLDRIGTDVPTFATLFGIAPRSYVSGFTSQSNIHEIVFARNVKNFSRSRTDMPGGQYHERVAWTKPCGGDPQASGDHIVSFDVPSLTRVLYGIYDKMFSNEKMQTLMSATTASKLMSLAEVNFHRESVAYLFQAVRRRVHLRNGTWEEVASRFMDMGIQAGTRVIEANNYQDICLQLHLVGITALGALLPDWTKNIRLSPRSNIFHDWKTLPPVVCVVLTVPRQRLQVFNGEVKDIGTPTMQVCLCAGESYENYFAAIHAVWGTCVKSVNSDRIVIDEDPRGLGGPSDLIIFFWATTRLLERPGTRVDLRLKVTPVSTMAFSQKLGSGLKVFGASVTDSNHVRVLPYRPTLASEPVQYPPSNHDRPVSADDAGTFCEAVVTGNTSRYVDSLCVRYHIKDPKEQESLLEGAGISAKQLTPCSMELTVGKYTHIIAYPYPIRESGHRLRVARKSSYIEIIVLLSKPSDNAGYFLNPFPLHGTTAYTPWNIHHLNLDRLPILDTTVPPEVEWLDPLLTLQLSDAEKYIRNGDQTQKEQAPYALLNLKDSLHAIAMHYSGIQGRQSQTIALCDVPQGGMYAILFISGIRLDLASMSIALDAAIVPLSEKRIAGLSPGICDMQRLSAHPIVQIRARGHELVAWKRVLPASVERCRNWVHKPNCEYRSQGRIPLSVAWGETPLCSCGEGVGLTGPQWNVPEWKGLLPFATRAAISPIFSVSYIESVAGALNKQAPAKPVQACWKYGGSGKPELLLCGKCKKAKYCSTTCQRQHWMVHKKNCKFL